MATLPLQNVSKSSAALTYSAAASGGDDFSSFTGVFVHVKNEAGVSRVITISAVTDPLVTPEAGSLTVPDVVITVPADDDRIFAVPPSHISAGGSVSMTYDNEADLTLAVLHVQQ